MISAFRVDVLDSSSNKVAAPGPITEIVAMTTIDRVDAAGEIQWVMNATGEMSQYIEAGKRYRAYALGEGELGEYLYKSAQWNASKRQITVAAWDLLRELVFDNTLTGREYEELPSSTIAANILALASNTWASNIAAGNTTSVIFQGESLLAALDILRQQTGEHFRLNRPYRSLEWGSLQDDSGVRLTNLPPQLSEIHGYDEVAIIDSLTLVEEEDEIWNRIYATGGTASNPVTMAGATAGSYTLKSVTGPDGSTLYYIEDTASQTTYGVREKVVRFSSVQSGLTGAADAVKLAAEAYLGNHTAPRKTYSVSGLKLASTVLPGQSVSLRYRGIVDDYKWLDVDTTMYLQEVQRKRNSDGTQSESLKVAATLVPPRTGEDVILDLLQDVQGMQYNA